MLTRTRECPCHEENRAFNDSVAFLHITLVDDNGTRVAATTRVNTVLTAAETQPALVRN